MSLELFGIEESAISGLRGGGICESGGAEGDG